MESNHYYHNTHPTLVSVFEENHGKTSQKVRKRPRGVVCVLLIFRVSSVPVFFSFSTAWYMSSVTASPTLGLGFALWVGLWVARVLVKNI